MFEKLDIFAKATGLAKHAATRQSVIAQNVANADTLGYHARDVVSFSETLDSGDATSLRATRSKHIGQVPNGFGPILTEEVYRQGAMSPNGNSVSLETEMMAAAEAKRDHDMALAIYQTSLGIMRSALGRR